jgi:hypothetical protein
MLWHLKMSMTFLQEIECTGITVTFLTGIWRRLLEYSVWLSCLWLLFVFWGNSGMPLCGMRQDMKSGIGTGGTKQYHRCDVKSTNWGMYPDKSFHGFPPSLQELAKQYLKTGHKYFLPTFSIFSHQTTLFKATCFRLRLRKEFPWTDPIHNTLELYASL